MVSSADLLRFNSAEKSASRSRPIDLYVIATKDVVYRMTSYTTDVTYNNEKYIATPGCGRGTIALTSDGSGSDDAAVVYIPISHPIVQAYASRGLPPRQITVTVMRLQSAVSIAIQQLTGFAQSMSINDNGTAQIRVPSTTNDALKIQLTSIAAQRTCNHRLFDPRCASEHDGPNPDLFAITVPVVAVSANGITLTVSGLYDRIDRLSGWAVHGVVTSGSESRSVIAQSNDVLTLDLPFSAAVQATVKVRAGCDHTISTCVAKFNNRLNFGGHPQMNTTINPWLPAGLGVAQQA